jgi:hypothetical protein
VAAASALGGNGVKYQTSSPLQPHRTGASAAIEMNPHEAWIVGRATAIPLRPGALESVLKDQPQQRHSNDCQDCLGVSVDHGDLQLMLDKEQSGKDRPAQVKRAAMRVAGYRPRSLSAK